MTKHHPDVTNAVMWLVTAFELHPDHPSTGYALHALKELDPEAHDAVVARVKEAKAKAALTKAKSKVPT